MLNICCSVLGCTNPVIGQCPGYEGNCGRYYCATHSTDNLCADCARRKLEDETAQRTYEDYLQTAERLQRELGRPGWMYIAALVILVLLGLGIGRSNAAAGIAICYGGTVVISIWIFAHQRKQEKVRLEEIRETKPGFPEFYKAWKKEKTKEVLMKGLAIAGVIGVIAAAVILEETGALSGKIDREK